MPTPLSVARLYLAADSASAIDAAVSAATRRQHAQTTSLHVVYSLLSATSSPLLQDALSRSTSSAYSPRLQFKALELCFGVALDRLPSTSSASNLNSSGESDPFISNSLMAAIKRSQATQRRNPDTFQYYQQQMNMNNSMNTNFSVVKVELQQLIVAILDDPIVSKVFGEAGFKSTDIKMAILRPPPPISRFAKGTRIPPLFLSNFSNGEDADIMVNMNMFSGDENCKRIGEIMGRSVNRNPMLVGVGACDAARDFIYKVGNKNLGVLPSGILNMKYAGLEKDFFDVRKKLDELVEEESGVLLGVGDLKVVLELSEELINSLVNEISRVLDVYKGKFWVMGWSKSYESYIKFLSKYPTLDKDWDLQLQLITTSKASISRTPSLMESFVPFGGFFPSALESNILVVKPHPPNPRCQHCTEMYEQELAAILKDCASSSSSDHNKAKLPSWMLSADTERVNNPSDSVKVKDHEKVLNTQISELQKKWNDKCHQTHQSFQNPNTNMHKALYPTISFPLISQMSKSINPSIINPISSHPISEPTNKDLISNLQAEVSRNKANVSKTNELTYLAPINSITTDLVLGSPSKKSNELPQKNCKKFETGNFKEFLASFLEKVGRQEAAIRAISHKIIECKYGQERRRGTSLKGDIWFNFSGEDRYGKRKVAIAMAELMFGSKENMICFDLNYQDNASSRTTICEQTGSGNYDTGLRGKTVADQIAGEISKKPSCVVLLENVEKADILVQDQLSQAIRMGKISDSNGREININNTIFVLTTNTDTKMENTNFFEKKVLKAQTRQMKLSVDIITDNTIKHPKFNISVSKQNSRKRKLDAILDLNLPLEDSSCSSSGIVGDEDEDQWLNEFLKSMDVNVEFDHFDFDSLGDYALQEINKLFCSIFGSDCFMEIDEKAMEQILAAAWSSEDIRNLNGWLNNVLLTSFIELRKNYSNQIPTCSIVKLMVMEEMWVDQFAHGVLLPSKILVSSTRCD